MIIIVQQHRWKTAFDPDSSPAVFHKPILIRDGPLVPAYFRFVFCKPVSIKKSGSSKIGRASKKDR
jgi:hypothetical protein